MAFHTIALTLPAGLDDASAGSFASSPCDLCSGWNNPPLAGTATRLGNDHRNDWRLEWLFAERTDIETFLPVLAQARAAHPDVPEISAAMLIQEELADTNWLEQCYQQFQPFVESGFYIYGSHAEFSVPDNLIGLQIDAATAFGSGEHGTTAGCLQILAELKHDGFSPRAVLDLGTGSGILAIAAYKLWQVPVLATDIDPESVRVSERHCGFNGVTGKVLNIVSEGFAAPELDQKNRFDLTIANILAGPLKEMAADIAGVTTEGGLILLSGMLREQADEVLAVYAQNGCLQKRRLLRGDWASLLLVRN